LPPGDDQTGVEARLTPVDDWCVQHGASLAINANYFSKVSRNGTSAEYADIIGLSVSDGVVVSPSRSYGSHPDPALIITGGRRARIAYVGNHDLDQVIVAVAGIGGSSSDPERGTLLVDDRINLGDTARVEPDKRHPRTAAGVSRDGRTLWLVVVDGRQPGWSVGMTLPELAELMIGLGAYDAVNLDGGGSSTLIYRSGPAAETFVNRPSDKSGFRPVANALGFRLIDDMPAQQASAARWAGE
jgi:exopolysaccharide biosynthesis protein